MSKNFGKRIFRPLRLRDYPKTELKRNTVAKQSSEQRQNERHNGPTLNRVYYKRPVRGYFRMACLEYLFAVNMLSFFSLRSGVLQSITF